MNIDLNDIRNVLILARRAISLSSSQMPANEGEAAFRSISAVEALLNSLVEQQKNEQSRIDAAVAQAEQSLEKATAKMNFVELNDEPPQA